MAIPEFNWKKEKQDDNKKTSRLPEFVVPTSGRAKIDFDMRRDLGSTPLSEKKVDEALLNPRRLREPYERGQDRQSEGFGRSEAFLGGMMTGLVGGAGREALVKDVENKGVGSGWVTGGEVLGSFAPIGASYGLGSKALTRFAPQLISGSAKRLAALGAISGAGYGVIKPTLEGESVGEIAKQGAVFGALGAVTDPVLEKFLLPYVGRVGKKVLDKVALKYKTWKVGNMTAQELENRLAIEFAKNADNIELNVKNIMPEGNTITREVIKRAEKPLISSETPLSPVLRQENARQIQTQADSVFSGLNKPVQTPPMVTAEGVERTAQSMAKKVPDFDFAVQQPVVNATEKVSVASKAKDSELVEYKTLFGKWQKVTKEKARELINSSKSGMTTTEAQKREVINKNLRGTTYEELFNVAEDSVAPKINQKVKLIDDELASLKKSADDEIKMFPERKEMVNKKVKGKALRLSAEKRKAIQGDSLELVEGGLTPKELSKVIEREKNVNYIGKKVSTPLGTGEVVGNSFGKVNIKMSDGSVQSFVKKEVEPLSVTPKISQSIKPLKEAPAPVKAQLDEVVIKNAVESGMLDEKAVTSKIEEIVKINKNNPQMAIEELDEYVKKLPMDLQLHAKNEVERVKKMSKFYTSIVEKSELSQKTIDEVKDIRLDFMYEADTNKRQYENALKRISGNEEALTTQLYGKENLNVDDRAALILLSKHYDNIKEYDTASLLLEKLSKAGTKSGQEVQVLSLLNRFSPEGMTHYFNKQAKKATSVKKIKAREATAKRVFEDFAKTNSEAVNSKQLQKEVIEHAKTSKKLVNLQTKTKIKQAESAKTLTEIAQNIYDLKITEQNRPELKKYAKRSREILESKMSKLLSNEKEIASLTKVSTSEQALANRAILEENLSGIPFNLQLFAKKQIRELDELINNKTILKELDEAYALTINKLAKEHYEVPKGLGKSLADKIKETTGVNDYRAGEVAEFIQNKIEELTKEKKQKIIDGLLNKPQQKKAKTAIERVSEYSKLGVFDEETFTTLLNEKLGIPYVTRETAEKISNKLKTIENITTKEQMIQTIKESQDLRGQKLFKKEQEYLEKQLAKYDFEKLSDLARLQVLGMIDDTMPRSSASRLSTYQAMSHLLNFTTAGRNFASNIGFNKLVALSDEVSNVFDILLSKYTGQRTVGRPRLLSDSTGAYKKGFNDSFVDVALDVFTPNLGKYDLTPTRTFKPTTRTNKVLGAGERLLAYSLRSTDEASKNLIKEDVTKQLKKLGTFTDDEIAEMAQKEALKRTFQDSSNMAKIFQGAKSTANIVGFGNEVGKVKGIGTKEFGLGDFLMKYPTVPANIIDRTVEFSPLGLLKIATLREGFKYNPVAQRQLARILGQATTGSALISLGALAAKTGFIESDSPSSSYGIEALKRSEGLGSNKLNATGLMRYLQTGKMTKEKGDVFLSFGNLDPIATPMAIGAAIQNEVSKNFGSKNVVPNSAKATFDELLDIPALYIINKMFQEEHTIDKMLVPIAEGAGGFVPSMVRQIAQQIDDVTREKGKSQFERVGASVSANIPFLSKTLEPKISPTGKELRNPKAPILSSFDIFNSTRYNPSGYTEQLEDLYRLQNVYQEKTGDKRNVSFVPPTSIAKTREFVEGGKIYKLTEKEYTKFNRDFRTFMDKAYTENLKGVNVKKLTDAEREELAKKLSSAEYYARKYAKEEYLKGKSKTSVLPKIKKR